MSRASRFRQITTYDHVSRLYRSWAGGHLPFLAVVGRSGTGKTHEYEDLLVAVSHHLFRGRTSAITLYQEVKDRPNQAIVFDDVRELLRDSSCLDLMKQLCDTRPRRTIRWRTRGLLDQDRQFCCSSNVLVVMNWVPKKDPDVDAILDRFDVVEFAPTKKEIIARMRLFAQCQADVFLIANRGCPDGVV